MAMPSLSKLRPGRPARPKRKRRRPGAFAAQFMKNPAAVGTLFRSGPVLARRLAKETMRFSPSILVEIGCGDGAITGTLRRQSERRGVRLLAIDINDELLARNKNRGHLVRADARHLPIRSADVIVCGLPLALMGRELVLSLLQSFRAIAPHFAQFQYSTARYRLIRRVYPEAKVVTYVLSNIPPAVVIVA